MAQYNEVIGERKADNLIANINIPLHTQGITLAADQGVLKRGTVLTADGKIMASGLTAHGILCDDADTATETVAEVYVSGCFNKGALIVADGYALAAADVLALRNGGIYVENIVD